MGAKPSAFRRAACLALRGAMEAKGLRPAAAARDLGISRQRLNTYLRGKVTPSAAVLAAACSRWDFSIDFRGYRFSSGSFRQPTAGASAEAVQLALYDTLRRSQRALRVRVRRVPNGVQLTIIPVRLRRRTA